MTLACIIASASTLFLVVSTTKSGVWQGLHLLGWWPIDVLAILRSTLLIAVLYTGPLFEEFVVEQNFRNYRPGGLLFESLSSWTGYRNYVAGPVTEEIIFRSVIVPLHLLAKVSVESVVLFTPVYFAFAHVHHFYEFVLTHPHTPRSGALGRTIFQFAFTTVFGWLATFIYLRTGSIYACILTHQFCNWYGIPRFWGRVRQREQLGQVPVLLRGKDDMDSVMAGGNGKELGLAWTVLYYILLICGVVGFKMALMPLTQSANALSTFAAGAESMRHN